MKREDVEHTLNKLIDELARIEHERWSHWQRFMHGKGLTQSDGSLLIPADLAKRWQRQIDTVYEDLTEEEKESDREQVRKYLPVIVNALKRVKD